jgi:dethiobiotin synthetase
MHQLQYDYQGGNPMKRIFVTGISTGVGKTIASAILVEALQADYWKPIQAGDLDASDSHKVAGMISNPKSIIHKNWYALSAPMSPHAAAAIDGVDLKAGSIIEPESPNHMVIEGAGGLLVPLNEHETILDLIQSHYKVVVVSRHYLGSINHTLLTLGCLKEKGLDVSLIFSGNANPATENIILNKSGIRLLGRINEESSFDRSVILRYAGQFRQALELL